MRGGKREIKTPNSEACFTQNTVLNKENPPFSHSNDDMYSGDFDGNFAFSGNGFMPSQAVHAPDSGFSPARKSESRCLLPLTVKQIKDLQNSNDGAEGTNLTLVGRICNIDDRNITQNMFLVDDGTGQIECTKWNHDRTDSNEVEKIRVGMYVRVHGELKGISNKPTLSVFSMRPVTDFNEIPTHFAECIYVHLYNTKLQGASSAAHPQMTNPNLGTPSKGYQATPSNQFYGVQRVDERIKEFLEQPAFLDHNGEHSHGVHRDDIARQLNVPVDEITEPLSFLVNEGDVYTTSDDFHYKSARNG